MNMCREESHFPIQMLGQSTTDMACDTRSSRLSLRMLSLMSVKPYELPTMTIHCRFMSPNSFGDRAMMNSCF